MSSLGSLVARSDFALYRIAGLVSLVALGGCATLANNIDGGRGNYLVSQALTENPASLKASADQGYAKPQYAYGLVLEFGLQGVPQDPATADAYKKKAMSHTGKVLQNGVAVGVTYEVNPIEASSAEECLQWLKNERGLEGRDDEYICGGTEAREKFKALIGP